jgi:phospholipase/carboxylesterase
MLSLVEELNEECILVGIRGDLPFENGYAYYHLKGYGNPERALFDNSVKKLKDTIQYLSDKYPIDETNRYIIGFSQGAILSLTLALILGDSIRGIVPMNGYIPQFVKEEYELKPISHLSVFHCQGAKDPIFPMNVGGETDIYLREYTQDVKYSIYPSKHEISKNNQEDIVVWLRQKMTSEV